MKMKFSTREWALMGALLVIVAVSGFIFLVLPRFFALGEQKNQNQAAAAAIRQLEARLEGTERLQKTLSETESEADPLLRRIPDRADNTAALTSLNGAAAGLCDQLSITFNRESMVALPEADGGGRLRLTAAKVSFSATPAGTEQFLTRLFTLPLLNRVTVGSITQSAVADGTARQNVSLTVEFVSRADRP